MCEDSGGKNVIVLPDPPAPTMTTAALCIGGASSIALGLLFIQLALFAECMVGLHALVGIILAVLGVFELVVGLVSVRRSRDFYRIMKEKLAREEQLATKAKQ